MTPGYYSRSLDGHRASYLEFVTSRFGGRRIGASQVFGWKGPVLFLMVEEHFGLYLMASLWRSLLGRRTAGLLFRPVPAISGTALRLRLKRWLLSALKYLPRACTLSIVPIPLDPRINALVHGWVHDFQLWDLSVVERESFTRMRLAKAAGEAAAAPLPPLLAEAINHAQGRPLLVALGVQNRDKGVERLAASLREGGTLGWAVLIAGRFAPAAEAARRDIEAHGGLIIDRFITDDELLALYATADAVWCVYDPSYDQASGILGRALQLGVPPVVRRGSISEALCQTEGVAHAVAEGGADLAAALAKLPPRSLRAQGAEAAAIRRAQNNVRRMRRVLGLSAGSYR